MKTRNVREHIHHGDYINDRWVEVELTPAGIAAMLADSPYNSGLKEDDPRTIELADKLFHTGYAQFGWADYRVVDHQDAALSGTDDPADGYSVSPGRRKVYTVEADGLILLSPSAADDGHGSGMWDTVITAYGDREASIRVAKRGEPVDPVEYTDALAQAGWEVIGDWKQGMFKKYAFVRPVSAPE